MSDEAPQYRFSLVKVLGERNTGTNFLSSFLSLNFVGTLADSGGRPDRQARADIRAIGLPKSLRAQVWESARDFAHFAHMGKDGGWKHAAPDRFFVNRFAEPHNAFVLMQVRHPATWLKSMFRNPFHTKSPQAEDFSDFLRAPWVCCARDRLDAGAVETPLDLLRLKYERYLWLTENYPQCRIIRYEDLATDTAACFASLCDSLTPKSAKPQLPEKGSRPFLADQQATSAYVERARSASYDQLSETDRAFVLKRLAGTELLKLYPY